QAPVDGTRVGDQLHVSIWRNSTTSIDIPTGWTRRQGGSGFTNRISQFSRVADGTADDVFTVADASIETTYVAFSVRFGEWLIRSGGQDTGATINTSLNTSFFDATVFGTFNFSVIIPNVSF